MNPDEYDAIRLQDERDASWDAECEEFGCHEDSDPGLDDDMSGPRQDFERWAYSLWDDDETPPSWRDRYDTREEWENSR
jgi:hypothetical protein